MTSPMIEAYEAQHGIKWEETARSVRACWHDAWCLAVEYKDAENAKLSESEIADASRVIEWARDPKRKPANLAFTAGAERQAAYWIEWSESENAKLREQRDEFARVLRISLLHWNPVAFPTARAILAEIEGEKK